MAKYIPKRSFLVRQDDTETGKKKDVVAKKGVLIELNDKEAIRFWDSLVWNERNEKDQKRLLAIGKANSYTKV